jgi:hypothetical protein
MMQQGWTLGSSGLPSVVPRASQGPRFLSPWTPNRPASASTAYTPPGATTLSPAPPLPNGTGVKPRSGLWKLPELWTASLDAQLRSAAHKLLGRGPSKSQPGVPRPQLPQAPTPGSPRGATHSPKPGFTRGRRGTHVLVGAGNSSCRRPARIVDAGHRRIVEPGEHELQVGASSADIRLRATVSPTGAVRTLGREWRMESRATIER